MTAANVVCVRHMWRARRLQWSKRRTRLIVVHYVMLNLQVPLIDIPAVHGAQCTCSSRRLGVVCALLIFTPTCAYHSWLGPTDALLRLVCADGQRSCLASTQHPGAADAMRMVRCNSPHRYVVAMECKIRNPAVDVMAG